ncbi:MAG: hypothetical protein ACRCT8_01325 [Lacipirellulaceae bacterium]
MAAPTPPPPADKKKQTPPAPTPKKEPVPKRPLAPGELSGWFKTMLSVGAAWHVVAVFLPPLSITASSELTTGVAQSPWLRWYTDPLYLNQGYSFFAPDPPINNLVRYTVTDASGGTLAEGEFPNRAQQWPRLYYHRHMMLADQAPNGPGGQGSLEWLQLSLRGYARVLLRRHEGAAEARLDYVRHDPLLPAEVQRGDDANAPEKFVALTSVVERASDLATPLWTAPPEPDPIGEPLPSGEPQ